MNRQEIEPRSKVKSAHAEGRNEGLEDACNLVSAFRIHGVSCDVTNAICAAILAMRSDEPDTRLDAMRAPGA